MAKKDVLIKKEIPFGVKIISILSFLGAAGELILALLLIIILIAGSGITKIVPSFAILGKYIIGGILILLALAALNFFIGLGLWKGQKWARIAAIISSIIVVLFEIFLAELEGNFGIKIIGIVVYSFIAGYLIFSKNVKAAFS